MSLPGPIQRSVSESRKPIIIPKSIQTYFNFLIIFLPCHRLGRAPHRILPGTKALQVLLSSSKGGGGDRLDEEERHRLFDRIIIQATDCRSNPHLYHHSLHYILHTRHNYWGRLVSQMDSEEIRSAPKSHHRHIYILFTRLIIRLACCSGRRHDG